MTDAPEPISTALADRMVREIGPDWTVEEATPLTGGHHPVAAVTVDAAGDRRRYVLKATRDATPETAATEARLLRLLATRTALPVPDVVGAVDDHGVLPAPFLLIEELPGRKYPRSELAELEAHTLSTIARSTGAQLAALHRVDAVESYGVLSHRRDPPLRGGRPRGSPDELTLEESFDDWPAAVAAWAEQAIEALAGTRFDDLVSDLRAAMAPRIDRLEAPAGPVLAHIDWSLDNLLLDPETHDVTGLPDWEFTVAAARGYDLVYAARSLAGGPWSYVPDYPDVHERVVDGLVVGYRDHSTADALEAFPANRETYALLNIMHGMIHTTDRLELDGATAEQLEGAMARLRERVKAFC